jgi:hypothetical protein
LAFASVASEITYIVQERAFDFLDAPIQRITTADTPAPYSPVLLKEWLPNADDVKAVKSYVKIQLTCYRSFIIHLFDEVVLNSTMKKRIFIYCLYF